MKTEKDGDTLLVKPYKRFYYSSAIFAGVFFFLLYKTATLFFPQIADIYFFKISDSYIDIKFMLIAIVIIGFIGAFLQAETVRFLNEYRISDDQIVVKQGLFKNETIIPVNGRLLITSRQNVIDYLLGLVNIELEADGDSSSPEAVLLHVPTWVFNDLTKRKRNKDYY